MSMWETGDCTKKPVHKNNNKIQETWIVVSYKLQVMKVIKSMWR